MAYEQNNNIQKESVDYGDESCRPLKKLEWQWKDIHWYILILQVVLLIHFPYGVYLCFFGCHNFFYTHIYGYCFALLGGIATTAGNHRYWSHKSYKANLPYRILLMLFSSSFLQFDTIKWCQLHRLHHKFAETEADPHNVKRGFFYSHVGWLLFKEEPPEVKEKLKCIDISDLLADPVLMFQRRHFVIITIIMAVLVPPILPMLWGESFWLSFNLYVIMRFAILLHIAFSVNSFAHLFGNKPYDKAVSGCENKLVIYLAAGEGWHNYHHTFPQDYRASEFPWKLNITTMFIDFFALIGWVSDRKTISGEIISQRKCRTGEK